MNFIRTSLLGLLALPLAAQSSGFNASGALILAPSEYFESYSKAVNSSTGLLVNVGYDFNVYQTDVGGRATLGFGYMPGTEKNGLKTSLTLVQLTGDIFLPTPAEGLRGVVGLSIDHWSASFSGTENWQPADVDHHFPFKDIKGLKGGFRLGLDYVVNKSVSAELVLQQTELAGHNGQDSFVRTGGINPAWLQLGVRYQF